MDDLPALERKVEKLKRERDVAAGVLKEKLARLKTEFGCEDLKTAERLLRQYQDEEIGLLKKYNRAREAFDAKWKAQLQDL